MSRTGLLMRFLPSRAQWVSGAIILSSCALAYGVPNLFTAGTTISAEQMNQNFADLEKRVAELEAKLASVSVETVNSHTTVRFSGVNVQIVNGTGDTETANGVGNLVVGYDEPRGNLFVAVCSDGGYTTQLACETAGKVWAMSHKSGSHYVVVGKETSYSQYGGLVTGWGSASNGPYASVLGGIAGVASGVRSVAIGGDAPNATGRGSVVVGGLYNKATGIDAVASGGKYNSASGTYAVVSGGGSNTASGTESASVFGGVSNTASGGGATVSGGVVNTASGPYAVVSGGSTRTAAGDYDWVAGALFQDY